MKGLVLAILVLVTYSGMATCKVFQQCNFVKELYENHIVPVNEIYKHVCVSQYGSNSSYNTTGHSGNKEYLGIYNVGSEWWCSWDGHGDGCNMNCNSLLDDDITDDVVCMQIIMAQHGVAGWSINNSYCLKNTYQK